MYNGYGTYSNQYQQMANPYQPQMDRLQQMQQQFQPQQNIQPQQATQQNQVIPVGSIEEVKAYNNYFDGQPHYFVDSATNKIYIKQLGNNGIPLIKSYSLDIQEEKTVEYATKDEVTNLKKIIDDLLNKLGGIKDE